MAKVRKIPRHPKKGQRNLFLVDASFLAEKYLPVGGARTATDAARTRTCREWWKEIDRQIKQQRARVYIPDVCIAEASKVLAKKYYQDGVFASSVTLKIARDRLASDITLSHKALKQKDRYIGYHDLPTTREVITSIDRFYEVFMKHKCNVGVIDLILLASAKYLIDFHDASRADLHIVTLDDALWRGTKKIPELPNAYDPTKATDGFAKVFR